MKRCFQIGDETVCASFQRRSPTEVEIAIGDDATTFRVAQSGQRVSLRTSERNYTAVSAREKDKAYVWLDGYVYELTELEESTEGHTVHGDTDVICAPMPGIVIKIDTRPGEFVAKDQIVAVLEAMKMEHNLRAPRAGTIEAVHVSNGQTVSADTPLVQLKKP